MLKVSHIEVWETKSLLVVSELSRCYDEEKSSCPSFHSSLMEAEWSQVRTDQAYSLGGLLFFFFFTFWFSFLLPGHLLSRLLCLIFHLLFSLNFLPPAFSFDLQFLLKLLFTFTAPDSLLICILHPHPPFHFFFLSHYFYIKSHLFFLLSFIYPFLCFAAPVNLPFCSWRQAIDLPLQTAWRSSETGAGGESPCQYFLKEWAREDLSLQHRHACFPFSRECTILSYSGLSH